MILWFVFYLENNSFLYYYASNTITQTFSSYGKTPNFKQKLIYKLLWAKSLLITLCTLAHFWVFNMNTKYSPKVFTQIAGEAAVIDRWRWYPLQDQAALEADSPSYMVICTLEVWYLSVFQETTASVSPESSVEMQNFNTPTDSYLIRPLNQNLHFNKIPSWCICILNWRIDDLHRVCT